MMQKLAESADLPKNPDENRPYIAVASLEGFMINQHLGEAERFLIYGVGTDNGEYVLVDSRKAPSAGGGKERWETLAATLIDCRAVLVNGAGGSPIKAMNAHGIDVMVLEGSIEKAVKSCFGKEELRDSIIINPSNACGPSCSKFAAPEPKGSCG